MARGWSFVTEASYVPGRPASQHVMGSDGGTKVRKTEVVGEIRKRKEMSSSEWSDQMHDRGHRPGGKQGTWKAFRAWVLGGAR